MAKENGWGLAGSHVTEETLYIDGADLGGYSSVPPLVEDKNVQTRQRRDTFDHEGVYLGYGNVDTILPYVRQECYTRMLSRKAYRSIVVENDCIRAVFLPELGGKLWRLTDKIRQKELLYVNDVVRPCNLALCNAWTSGGVEWNVGLVGHSPFTCSPLHTAVLEEETPTGRMQVLRMYEFERIRRVVYQMDFYIPPHGRFLHARISLYNLRDEVVPMYWWSNIAVPEEDEARVIVPADSAYTNEQDTVIKVPTPVIEGRDISYPMRIRQAKDYFFDIPEEEPKYIAYARKGEPLFLQASTSRLKGRKLFVWGQGTGSQHWQNFLTREAGRYCEIQAGLAKTQYGCIPMGAGETWEWIELYGAVPADEEALFGGYEQAQAHMRAALGRLPEFANLEQELEDTAAMARRPGRKILDGSGFGYLENQKGLYREKRERLPAHLAFTSWQEIANPDMRIAPWLALLKGEALQMDPAKPPMSYMLYEEWEALLQERGASGWWQCLQLGILAFARQEYTKARQWLTDSLADAITPWALIVMAHIAVRTQESEQAISFARQALQLEQADVSLIRAALRVLLENEAYTDIVDMALIDDVRCQLYRAQAFLAMGQWEKAEKLLMQDGGLEVPDIREGENTLTSLWAAIQKKRAENAGREWDASTAPLPYKLDFRMDGSV